MSGILDLVSQYLGEERVDALASEIGASREQTENAIGMALPTLLGALARKADDEQGVHQLHHSLAGLDGSLLDKLQASSGSTAQGIGALSALTGGDLDGLLGGLLGGRKSRVEQGIGKASGLDLSQVAKLLALLWPLLMSVLSKKSRSEQMDPGDLGGMLRGERKNMENQASGGLLAGLLDQDGDGDFDFQDILKLGMNRLFRKS